MPNLKIRQGPRIYGFYIIFVIQLHYYHIQMKKDQPKINKFLELVPDDSIKRTFYSLSSSKIIRRNDLYMMDCYLEYIRDYNLVFEDEILNTNHKNFHKSFDELDSFLLANFFPIDSQPDFFQLYDSGFIERNEEKYLKFEKELEIIINEAENNYILLRKAIEVYILENDTIENKTINISTSKNKSEVTQLSVGPLSCKNGLIYYNESMIDNLTKQMIKLCFLFLMRKNEFLSYETIQSELSDSDYITKENMQKVVSKLRNALKKRTHKNLIENVSGEGYLFNTKEIT